jgi:hypothetical protein
MGSPDADGNAARPDRYGRVLALLAASCLLTSFLPDERARVLPLLLYVTALTIALRDARRDRPVRRRLFWSLIVGSVVAGILLTFVHNRPAHGLVSL